MQSLIKISDSILSIERILLMLLVSSILGLMILNVVTRAINISLYWVDETAINLKIMATFIGTNLIFRQRKNFSVSIVLDILPAKYQHSLSMLVQLISLGFAGLLIIVTLKWFDPVTLIASNFDLNVFFKTTYNSIYTEMTSTIGIRRFWFFLIMPWFSCALFIHCLACIAEDLSDVNEDTQMPQQRSI
jgi:TRAP-type C4-dicarboxylate transport system permease small subunit